MERALRHAQHLRRLVSRHAREVAKVHDLRLERVFLLQLGQSIVHGENVLRPAAPRSAVILVQLDAMPAAAAPRPRLAPGVLHEDVAHGPGRREEEVPAALQVQVGLADQAQIGLVDHGGRLQGRSGWQLRHARLRELAQLRVHQGQQSGCRFPVASLCRLEDGRHVTDCVV